jgi:hypothetical protein
MALTGVTIELWLKTRGLTPVGGDEVNLSEE